MFGFWDWVGGRRYSDGLGDPDSHRRCWPSVPKTSARCSPVSMKWLDDTHCTAHLLFERNLPVLLGLLGAFGMPISLTPQPWRLLPYKTIPETISCLLQQLTMESNGKYITLAGSIRSITRPARSIGASRERT